MREQAQEQQEQRWVAHPVLARLVRGVLFAIPLLVSTATVLALRPLVPGGLGWAVALGLLAVVIAVVFERALRRFLPLATLLRLTMLFPDQAPSRYKVARSAGNPAELGRRLAHDPDAVSTAEQVLALITALGQHDRRTRGHSERVRVFCDLLAEQLHLERGDRDRLRWASLLHDVGKISIAPAVLNKPSRLDDREFMLIKGHPERGAALTAPLLPWLGEWGSGIVEHHERFDGAGYPVGLSGPDISRAGRIVGIVDAFETMTAARPYKKPMATRAAREELARCAGTQFDPVYVRAFLAISLPRLVWTMGPLSFALQLPFLSSIAQAGSRSAAVSGQAATAIAGVGAVAGVGMVGVLAPASAAQLPPPDQAVVAGAADARGVDAVAAPPFGDLTPVEQRAVPAPARLEAASVGNSPSLEPTLDPTGWPFFPIASTPVVRQPAAAPATAEEPVEAEPITAAPQPVRAPAPAPTSPPDPDPAPAAPAPSAPPPPAPPAPAPPAPPPPAPPVEVAPVVTLTETPAGTVASSSVTVAFVADLDATRFSCSVDGGSWTACSSPLVLTLADGEHIVAVRGTSASGLTGLAVTTPRFTVASGAPSVRLLDPPVGTLVSPVVTVAFQSDTVAATFECAVDSGLWTACTSPFTRTYDDGPHTVDVRAVGALSGAGAPVRVSFTVDRPGPELELTAVPAATVTSTTVELAFDSPEPSATFECAVDGGPWALCSSPARFELGLGAHVVAVRALTAAAGAGPAETVSFSVVPPTAVITAAPAGTVSSGYVQVSFTSDDPQAGFDCRIDGGTWTGCTSPLDLRLANGTHAVSVRAIGATTGPGPTTSTGSFVIDADPPRVSFDVDPPRKTDGPVELVFSSDQPEVTFACKVNSREWTACTSPAIFDLPVGSHVIMIRATSTLTGAGPVITTGSITVDRPGPRVVIDSAPSGTVPTDTVTLAFSSPDDVQYFQCSVDDGAWSRCTSPETFDLADGEHVLAVRGVGQRKDVGPAVATAPFTVQAPDDDGLSEQSQVVDATSTSPEAPGTPTDLVVPQEPPADDPTPVLESADVPVEQPVGEPVREPVAPSVEAPVEQPRQPADPARDVVADQGIEPARQTTR